MLIATRPGKADLRHSIAETGAIAEPGQRVPALYRAIERDAPATKRR